MSNQIIIGIGGNINSEDGTHPIKICNKAICSLQEYSIKVKKQSKWYNSEARLPIVEIEEISKKNVNNALKTAGLL